uniref:Uncharacterized protein n=1 Tax=Glossina palpalis gambiensis TaxID=67801 RepID=A0A1B0BPP9_9MUSC
MIAATYAKCNNHHSEMILFYKTAVHRQWALANAKNTHSSTVQIHLLMTCGKTNNKFRFALEGVGQYHVWILCLRIVTPNEAWFRSVLIPILSDGTRHASVFLSVGGGLFSVAANCGLLLKITVMVVLHKCPQQVWLETDDDGL